MPVPLCAVDYEKPPDVARMGVGAGEALHALVSSETRKIALFKYHATSASVTSDGWPNAGLARSHSNTRAPWRSLAPRQNEALTRNRIAVSLSASTRPRATCRRSEAASLSRPASAASGVRPHSATSTPAAPSACAIPRPPVFHAPQAPPRGCVHTVRPRLPPRRAPVRSRGQSDRARPRRRGTASNSSPNSCSTQRARMERVGANSYNLIMADHMV